MPKNIIQTDWCIWTHDERSQHMTLIRKTNLSTFLDVHSNVISGEWVAMCMDEDNSYPLSCRSRLMIYESIQQDQPTFMYSLILLCTPCCCICEFCQRTPIQCHSTIINISKPCSVKRGPQCIGENFRPTSASAVLAEWRGPKLLVIVDW